MKTSAISPSAPSPLVTELTISVVVPTFRRTHDLARCLTTLAKQQRRPNQVVVVVRDIDQETWDFLATDSLPGLPLQIAKVIIPGQIAALNAGVDQATGDIIAITDDDAAPHADWLQRIEQHFQSDQRIGGVGGRDWVYLGDRLLGPEQNLDQFTPVGRVQWWGRTIGNHHIGTGGARDVEVLKGANMSFRRAAIANLRFEERLLGTGAQVHNDLCFCLAVKKQGWRLIYDNQVAINHYPAVRFDEDQRDAFSASAVANAAHNETLAMLEYFPLAQRLIYLFWATLIGTRDMPGLLQMLRFFPQQKGLAIARWRAVGTGRRLGLVTYLRGSLSQSKI